MKYIQLLIILFFFSLPIHSNAFPIPDDYEVSFDVIRKNKVIGNLTSKFIKDDENIVLHSVLDINIKILFIPAYKFFQETKETWRNGEFISIDGFTDFEDDREYKIDGKDEDGFFRVTGMDGLLELDEKIIPLNYWNKNILDEKELFDTQKGIVRKITVNKLKDEEIKMNNSKLLSEKYTLNATKNPKDKGPFPEYTLWYYNDELLKMEFKNPNDKKNTITIIRNDWEN
ncbi:DUF6134 family protein [Alphaproteobacteria bacterium]|nr:DUF6134 family protein [Alphaproteobacteria bacterium]MDC3270133.1 DUF6134 family protein [Alphaproteobacteria bacterium]